MPSVLRFIRHWFTAAASDALHRMGTTALAVGVSLAPWAVALIHDFANGGVQAARANWSSGLIWAVCVWVALLAFYLHRHFRPVLREHRRVFHMLAFNQNQHSDPDRVLIWCLLQFCKDLGPATLTVRVTTLLARGPVTSVVHTENLGNVSRDEKKLLQLGSLRIARPHEPPRPAYHSIWGSEVGTEALKQGQVTIMTDSSRNLIDISVGPQTYRCYVEFVTPPPGALSAAMYLTDEDRSPWLLELSARPRT
jgi:hypothetical protein